MHFYKVFRSKKDLGVRTSKPIWAGISVHGVLTAEQQGSVRAVTRTHAWQNTQKISFKRRRFSIKPKSEVGIGKVAKLDYFTDSHRKCDTLCSFIIYCDGCYRRRLISCVAEVATSSSSPPRTTASTSP